MSEPIKVRRMKVEVTITREIVVVLPLNCTDAEAKAIIKEYELNEITDGQDVDTWMCESEVDHVNAQDPDLYIITEDGLAPAGGTEWEEEIEKYAVKTKEPHPEG